jgi:signal transduction histidine kinase
VSATQARAWWPAYQPWSDLGDARSTPRHMAGVVAFMMVLCLPVVTRATGIGASTVVAVIGLHVVWTLFSVHLLRPSAAPGRFRYQVVLAGNLFLNIGIAVAIPMLHRDARTPLWMLPVLYASLNGASQEREPAMGFLVAHAVAPLVAIPFLVAGASTTWGVAAPLLCAACSAVAYNHTAGMSARWQAVRRQNADALAAVRTELAVRDRQRLARDLDESIGSTLAVVGLYGDMIERHVDDPNELRAVAAMVREAARGGLGDLRGVIGAMAPAAADVDGLAGTLRQAAARAAEGRETGVVVRVLEGGAARLDGRVRLALVRVFQDAVHHAIRTAKARNVVVRLAASDDVVSLEIADDGACDASSRSDAGRMRSRAAELGGSISVEAVPEGGTVVTMSVPASRPLESLGSAT